jgi:hypothetical protein
MGFGVALILVLVLFPLSLATNWQHQIYVSSSDGVNDSSCWTGHVPCATLNLAVEGIQHNSTVIYLYPGIYTFENGMIKKKNYTVGVIGMRGNPGEQVILLYHQPLELDWIENIILAPASTNSTITSSTSSSTNSSTDIVTNMFSHSSIITNVNTSTDCCSTNLHIDLDYDDIPNGGNISFTASVSIANDSIPYMSNKLSVNIVNVSDIGGSCYLFRIDYDYNYGSCTFYNKTSTPHYTQGSSYTIGINCSNIISYPVNVTLSFNVTLSEQTLLTYNTVTIHPCESPFITKEIKCHGDNYYNEYQYQYCSFIYSDYIQCLKISENDNSNNCNGIQSYTSTNDSDREYDCVDCNYDSRYAAIKKPNYCISDNVMGYCPLSYNSGDTRLPIDITYLFNTSFCGNNREGRLCGQCSHGTGVPINILNQCVDCSQYSSYGWLIFIAIEILPMTVIVLLILIFNIQLTNGSINGLVFFYQIMSIVYPGFTNNVILIQREYYNYFYYYYYTRNQYFITPFVSFFNLEFSSLLSYYGYPGYPLCITSDMSPLGAIFFWYVIGLYPLVLLLLLYGWIVLYDKGYKCVVFITRPIHRCLARFWRITKIEPSLLHSLASIYLLCFTQLASTSLLLLHFTPMYDISNNIKGFAFFFDGSLDYFGWPHCVCGIFAIVILVCLVLIPMLYIQLYPLKLFHKLLDVLHVRKQVLISLGDVFTGSYKNGSDNTFDYRYLAGLYLLVRIIVLCLHFIPFEYNIVNVNIQCVVYVLIGGIIIIFRPHLRNIHNFNEFVIFITLVILAMSSIIINQIQAYNFIFFIVFCYLFFLILIGYSIYRIVKMMRNCCLYCKSNRRPNPPPVNDTNDDDESQLLLDNNEFADRIENPDDYDEHHVQDAPYENYPTPQVNAVDHAPSNYGTV